MYDAMVTPGDVIVLQRQHTAEDGDLVMVVIDPSRETRIRRISFDGEQVRLEPVLRAIQPQTLAGWGGSDAGRNGEDVHPRHERETRP